jgi:hypothetical protein
MTPEERAEIARKNGAKSKGPTTPEGKAKVSRNGIKTGEYAETLSNFVPPDCAILCNEERQAFFELMDALLATYQPVNDEARLLVRQMAIARWQIERLNTCITVHWNLAVIEASGKPLTVVPELGELQTMARASVAVNTGSAIVEKLNRQIDRLEMRITRLRRAIRDVNAHSSVPVEVYTPKDQTQQPEPPPVENTEVNQPEEQKTAKPEPPIYITERNPLVIAAYRREFPGRRIILLPPDNVAKGIVIDDDMPTAPRKAA